MVERKKLHVMAKFKLGLDSLTYILIHYNNGQTLKFYSIDWGRGIKGKDKSVGIARLENNMLKNKATWERATLHEADNKILSYYHHSTEICPKMKKYASRLENGCVKDCQM
jgi:hypothetical protein